MYTAWVFLVGAAMGAIPCLIFIAKAAWRGHWADVVLVMCFPLFVCAIVAALAIDIGDLFQ